METSDRRGAALPLLALLLCSFLGFFFFPSFVLAQEVRFGHLTREDGLSSSSISGIAQDSRGFIWFGTKGGLNRYDGYSVSVYANDPFSDDSLSHNLVQTIFMDTGDILWAGTYRGLNRFDTGSKHNTRYVHDEADPKSLSNDVVTAVCRDSSGRLWAGTLDGLNLLDEAAGTFKRYAAAPGVPGALGNGTVRAIAESRDGTLWIGTYGGLYRYRSESDTFEKFEDAGAAAKKLPSDLVMSIAEDPDGNLWIGCWGGGLARIGSDRHTVDSWSFPDNRFYSLCASFRGVVYGGTWGGGLVELTPGSGDYTVYRADPSRQFSLANDVIYSLFVDSSGLLWIGTNGGGAHKLDRSRDRFVLYRNDPADSGSLSKGAVQAIFEDSRGTLWAGTYNGGVCRLDPGGRRFTRYLNDPKDPRSLSNNIVNGIMEDSEGTLWFATNEGLNRLDRATGKFTRYTGGELSSGSLPDQTVYALTVDSEGRHWYGYFRKGAERYDPVSGERLRFFYDPADPRSLSDNLVYFIKEDSHRTIWIGTNGGLNRYDPETGGFVRYKHSSSDPKSLPSDTIRCMLEDSKGRLWFGSAPGGVSLLDQESGAFTHIMKVDGLGDDNVVALEEDEHGRIWIATNYGLFVYDQTSKDIKSLDLQDGLQGLEFSGGAFKNSKGELFFGGAEGMNRISSAALKRNLHIPPVQITSFKVFGAEPESGRDFSDLREIKLTHQENFISIEFAALDYMDPRSNRYSYMLEGFDKDWIYSGSRRFASYTNLPGGDYVFRVKASNNHGVWNQDGVHLQIKVTPPFWLTPAAFILYTAMMLFIVAGISLWASREHRLRLSVAELAERRRISMELRAAKERAEDADRAKSEFLANLSHEIRTPMNAVLGYSGILAEQMSGDSRRSLVDIIDRSARSLLALLNDALDLSRMDAGKAPRHNAVLHIRTLVADLVEMFRLKAEQKGLVLEAAVSDMVPQLIMGDEMKLRQILVNLIGNAIKFTETGSVRVELLVSPSPQESTDERTLVLKVEDTGIGLSDEAIGRVFEPFYQAEHTDERYGGTGLGLTIVERLVKSLNGEIFVRSDVGAGTCFTVRLPNIAAVPENSSAAKAVAVPEADRRRVDGADLLVIDDDDSCRDVLRRIMEARGASVRMAKRSDVGMRRIEERRPDVLFMDIRMPKMDGFGFLDAIRRNESTSDLPVIVVTADLREQVRSKLAPYASVVFVPKPFGASALLDALSRAAPGVIASLPLQARGPSESESCVSESLLSYDCLSGDRAAADRVIELLRGSPSETRRRITDAFILDEWTAFLTEIEGAAAETGSAVLRAFADRISAALEELDGDRLKGLAAEFDDLLSGFPPSGS